MADDTESSEVRRGVLFDVDGTLVDSNYLHTIAWWQSFRRFGHDVPMSGIHRAIGMGGDKLVAHLLGEGRDAGQDTAIDSTHGAIFSSFWPSLRAFDGAAELVRRCADDGLVVVLASSASQDDVDANRAVIDADDAIAAATTTDDAGNSKPSPDILQAALDAGGLEAANVVFVGDAVWDVIAATELGIPTIALASGGTSESELRDAGAALVYRDVRALLDAFDDGPLHALMASGEAS